MKLNIFSQYENVSNTKLAFPTFFTYFCGAERKEGRKQKTPSKMKLRLFTTACYWSLIAYFWDVETCANTLNFNNLPHHLLLTRATIFGI